MFFDRLRERATVVGTRPWGMRRDGAARVRLPGRPARAVRRQPHPVLQAADRRDHRRRGALDRAALPDPDPTAEAPLLRRRGRAAARPVRRHPALGRHAAPDPVRDGVGAGARLPEQHRDRPAGGLLLRPGGGRRPVLRRAPRRRDPAALAVQRDRLLQEPDHQRAGRLPGALAQGHQLPAAGHGVAAADGPVLPEQRLAAAEPGDRGRALPVQVPARGGRLGRGDEHPAPARRRRHARERRRELRGRAGHRRRRAAGGVPALPVPGLRAEEPGALAVRRAQPAAGQRGRLGRTVVRADRGAARRRRRAGAAGDGPVPAAAGADRGGGRRPGGVPSRRQPRGRRHRADLLGRGGRAAHRADRAGGRRHRGAGGAVHDPGRRGRRGGDRRRRCAGRPGAARAVAAWPA